MSAKPKPEKFLPPWKPLYGTHPPRGVKLLFMTERGPVVAEPSLIDGRFSLWNGYINGAKTICWMEIPAHASEAKSKRRTRH